MPAPAPEPVRAPAPEFRPAQSGGISYQEARTLRESEEARIAQIKRQQLEGSLTAAKPAAAAAFEAFRSLRDTCMPLGRRVAARVAAMTDAREIQLLIDEEMRTVLRTFSERTLSSLAGKIAPQSPESCDDATGWAD
jgi:hypothetical protein